MSDRQLLFFYLTDTLPDFCQTKYVQTVLGAHIMVDGTATVSYFFMAIATVGHHLEKAECVQIRDSLLLCFIPIF